MFILAVFKRLVAQRPFSQLFTILAQCVYVISSRHCALGFTFAISNNKE